MWAEEFEKLNNSEKEEMKRLLNVLLSKTCIVRDVYDTKEMMMKINPDYRFLERHFELVSEYLSYSGWDVSKDNQYGVISIENIYGYNKLRLDRFTTMTLYTIRLIYEEERERVTLRNEIMTTTGQIFHKIITREATILDNLIRSAKNLFCIPAGLFAVRLSGHTECPHFHILTNSSGFLNFSIR